MATHESGTMSKAAFVAAFPALREAILGEWSELDAAALDATAGELDKVVALVIERFDGQDARELELSVKTLRVLEIDGSTAIDRTRDILGEIAINTTWRGNGDEAGSFLRVCTADSLAT